MTSRKRSLLPRALVAVLLLFALYPASGAVAQHVTSATVSFTAASLQYISVSNTTVTFPTVAVSDYANGYVVGNANSFVTAKSNMTFSVSLTANATTMSATGVGARANKPASDLAVRIKPYGGSFGSVTGLSTGGTNVYSSQLAGDYSTQQPEVEYRTLLTWANDTPGTYSLGFTYTIVAN